MIVSSLIRPFGSLGFVDSAAKSLAAFVFEDDSTSDNVSSGLRNVRVWDSEVLNLIREVPLISNPRPDSAI
jgi:hypothetical protein